MFLSRVVAANLGFLLSSNGDFRDLPFWPQESPVSIRIVRGLSGYFCSCCRGRGPHLDLSSQPQIFAPVLTWISAFLRSFHRESGLVSCGDMQVWSPLKLENQYQDSCRVDIGIGGFFLRFHRAITPAIMSLVDPQGDRRVSAWESG